VSALIGFLINLQFFTVIPIKKQLPMEKKYMNRAIQLLPLTGLFLGIIISTFTYILVHWTPFSILAVSFLIWLLTIILTGGLHLDGWIDASDALFSYQDQQKRLEIMKDPRTGAFGVLSVIVLLAARFLFIYEIIARLEPATFLLILLIPFFSRVSMGLLLIHMPLAKQGGLAAFFQRAVQKNSTTIYWLYMCVLLAGLYVIDHFIGLLASGMVVSAGFFFLLVKRKIMNWFGGITGDVLGASVEGVEIWLWLTVWLLHYFAMA
jgi:adenosylcobinamide-GDP ribazoletransferase